MMHLPSPRPASPRPIPPSPSGASLANHGSSLPGDHDARRTRPMRDGQSARPYGARLVLMAMDGRAEAHAALASVEAAPLPWMD